MTDTQSSDSSNHGDDLFTGHFLNTHSAQFDKDGKLIPKQTLNKKESNEDKTISEQSEDK